MENKELEDENKNLDIENELNNNSVLTPLNKKTKEILETKEDHRRRKISRWVIYFSMFIQSIGFSIVLTGVWPYMELLEKNPDKKLLGWAVACNPIGQLIFSPIIGWWCNKIQSVRLPTIICIIIFIIANIWYGLLPLHSSSGQWFLMVARFLVGVSSGSIAVFRTYLTQSTVVAERTSCFSHLSLFQALGFILGPAVQAALVPLGKEGIKIGTSFSLSVYNSPGWVSAIFGIINLILFHPKFFQESDIAEKEAKYILEENAKKADSEKKKETDWSKISPDFFALFIVTFAFFIVLFNFILLETLAVPVAMDQWAWDETKAILWVGISISISSVLTTACFATVGPLCKRFDERVILIAFGMIPMIIGRIFFFPITGDKPAKIARFGCKDSAEYIFYDKNVCELAQLEWEIIDHGCPESQAWCKEISALNPWTIAVGYAICTFGYPYGIALLQTLYSKIIGPRPQGVWMGFLTSVASLSRAVGPIFVSYIYTSYGTIATNGIATGFMIFSLAFLALFHKRLVPIKVPEK